jgi:hypothetical protein
MDVRQSVDAYDSLRADQERIQRDSAQRRNDLVGGRRKERWVRQVNAHHRRRAQSPNARAAPPPRGEMARGGFSAGTRVAILLAREHRHE